MGLYSGIYQTADLYDDLDIFVKAFEISPVRIIILK